MVTTLAKVNGAGGGELRAGYKSPVLHKSERGAAAPAQAPSSPEPLEASVPRKLLGETV